MRRRVARLAETPQDVRDRQAPPINDGDHPQLRVRNHRNIANRLDAARVWQRPDVPQNPSALDIDRNQTRLEIRRHQTDRGPPSRMCRNATRPERERNSTPDELTPVHSPATAGEHRGVRRLGKWRTHGRDLNDPVTIVRSSVRVRLKPERMSPSGGKADRKRSLVLMR
jgi:hypothetical protein